MPTIAHQSTRLIVLGGLTALLAFALFVGVPHRARAVHAGFEAHVHQGTCDNLSSEPIADAGALGYRLPILGTPEATPTGTFTPIGPQEAFPVVTSTTTIDLTLDDLLATPHAIDVHVIDEARDTEVRLACGAVGGVPAGDDLVFGLQSVTADTVGVAWLHAENGQTRVTLFVSQGLSAEQNGAGATPRAGAPPTS